MMMMMMCMKSYLKLAPLKDPPFDHLCSPVPLLFLLRQGHHASLLVLLNLKFFIFTFYDTFRIRVLLQLQINIRTTP